VNTTPDALNPLSFGQDDSADFVYRFLFRGLLRYDTQSGSYQGDIAYCDMSDLLDVKCTLNDTAIWSDGSPIQTDDVIASISAYKKKATNPDMVAFFK
jgi:MarR-like DNA-binding transcriptional regulator SgrR of sgrS sRNA